MQDFRKLTVWQRSREFALQVYQATSGFSKHEAFGLTSQLRRAATSVPSNIAEGCGRGGTAELNRFLSIALGSASEPEYQLLLSRDLKYIDQETYAALAGLVVQVKRMLSAFIRRLTGQSSRRKTDL